MAIAEGSVCPAECVIVILLGILVFKVRFVCSASTSILRKDISHLLENSLCLVLCNIWRFSPQFGIINLHRSFPVYFVFLIFSVTLVYNEFSKKRCLINKFLHFYKRVPSFCIQIVFSYVSSFVVECRAKLHVFNNGSFVIRDKTTANGWRSESTASLRLSVGCCFLHKRTVSQHTSVSYALSCSSRS